MNLYCTACNRTHRYTAGEVERIVYALQAAEADERTADVQDRHDAGKDPMVEAHCFNYVLALAGPGSEMYWEHVENMVENRRLSAATTPGSD